MSGEEIHDGRRRRSAGLPQVWVALCGLAISAVGCGDSPRMVLSVAGFWNENPSTVAETGYQVSVDVGYPERHDSCFSLSPDLRVHVNDLVATPSFNGDCRWDALTVLGPVDGKGVITIRWQDGDRVLGEAQFENLFPGAGSRLLLPATGSQVKPGDPIAFTLPVPAVAADLGYTNFYWLDMPADAPPFHTFVSGKTSTDGTAFELMAPSLTGRAAMALRTVLSVEGAATLLSCTGFESCGGQPDIETVGPLYVEVVAP